MISMVFIANGFQN